MFQSPRAVIYFYDLYCGVRYIGAESRFQSPRAVIYFYDHWWTKGRDDKGKVSVTSCGDLFLRQRPRGYAA